MTPSFWNQPAGISGAALVRAVQGSDVTVQMLHE